MQDVAGRAGVSRTTVSLVLSGRPGTRVSPSTVRRVLHVAAELGYEPRTRRDDDGWITLLVEISAEGVLDLLDGAIEEGCRRRHAVLVVPVGASSGDGQATIAAVARYSCRRVAYLGLDEPAAESLGELPYRPAVVSLLRGSASDVSTSCLRVFPDDEQAGASTAETLAQEGHRRVALAADRAEFHTALSWKRGLERSARGFAEVPITLVPGEDGAPTSLWWMLGRSPAERPTAVVCASRRSAGQAVRTAAARGLGVPDDVAIVVRDGGGEEVLDVPHRPLRLPARAMGRVAVQVLLEATATDRAGPPRPVDVKVPFAPAGGGSDRDKRVLPWRTGARP